MPLNLFPNSHFKYIPVKHLQNLTHHHQMKILLIFCTAVTQPQWYKCFSLVLQYLHGNPFLTCISPPYLSFSASRPQELNVVSYTVSTLNGLWTEFFFPSVRLLTLLYTKTFLKKIKWDRNRHVHFLNQLIIVTTPSSQNWNYVSTWEIKSKKEHNTNTKTSLLTWSTSYSIQYCLTLNQPLLRRRLSRQVTWRNTWQSDKILECQDRQIFCNSTRVWWGEWGETGAIANTVLRQ